jgi:hypothetical protein
MPSLEVGIVKGGEEYLGEGMVGGHDESSMLVREKRVTTSSRSEDWE